MHKAFHYAKLRKKPVLPMSLADFQDIVLSFETQDYGYYFRTLPVRRKLNPYNKDERHLYVQELLESYDFVGVRERLHETLAVLQILLGLETQDVLFLQSPYVATATKDPTVSQTDYYEQWNKGECREIPSPEITLDMKKWFHSEEFEAFIEADVLVYKAVNQSLDKTIDAIGRDRVQKAVNQLKWALDGAKEACQNVRFPCSAAGKQQKPNDCFFSDVGCGHECLDQFGQSLSKNPKFQKLSQ